LVEWVWGEASTPGSKGTLQTYVSNLRAILGEVVVWEAGGYRLAVERDQVDALRFEDAVAEARALLQTNPEEAARLLRQALGWWWGRPFADVPSSWGLELEGRRLEELWLGAVEDRIEADLAVGRHMALLPELEVLTTEHPLSERLRAQHMVALYRSGRQAEALRVYAKTRALLVEEMGIDPSPELQELELRVLQQDDSLRLVPLASRDGAFEQELLGRWVRGYELRDEVGRGDFGVVHRAFQPSAGREVAVKVIRSELVNEGEFVRRFEAEAQIVSQLTHPHIVQLYDYWRDPEGGYLVMPWLRGGSLRDALVGDAWNLDRVTQVLTQVGSALAYAHRHGVVHRDMKPSNVLLDEDGNAYLSDFGIAARTQGADEDGRPESLSPAYVTPEERLGGRATNRSDVYGLAMLAFELLSGRTPPAEGPLPSLTEMRPDLSPRLEEAIVWATAIDPEQRCPSVDALLVKLFPGRAETGAVFTPTRNPYKGLRPFTESDAADYFGRESMIESVLAAIREHRLVAVVGASGIGKSSMVRAGLVPRLRSSTEETWLVTDLYPGRYPFEALAAALQRVAVRQPEELIDLVTGDDSVLGRAIEMALPPNTRLLLVIDQFEELFTQTWDEETRSRFLDSLTALGDHSPVTVLVTLRADFLDRPLLYPEFARRLAAGMVTMPAPDLAELDEIVRRPAENLGVGFAPGVVERIVGDVADQPGAVPLLEYALTELFSHRDGNELTIAGYEAVGGVAGALGQRAEDLFLGLEVVEQEVARQLFLRLVTVDDSGGQVRRRLTRSVAEGLPVDQSAMENVLRVFGDHRLITFDRHPLTRGSTVEVAHEALLTGWERLAGWIGERRQELSLTRRLDDAAEQWMEAEQDRSYLLTGGRLEQAETLVATSDLALSSSERSYLDASRRVENEQHNREKRRRRLVLSGFALAAVVSLGLAAWANREAAKERQAQELAVSRELAASAVNTIDLDPELSILLALEATERGDQPLEAVTALRQAVSEHRVMRTLHQPVDLAERLERAVGGLSPDGTLLAIAAGSHLELWESDGDEPVWMVDLPGDLPNRDGLQLTRPSFTTDATEIISLATWTPPRDAPPELPPGVQPGVVFFDVGTGEYRVVQPEGPCPLTGLVAREPFIDPIPGVFVESATPTTGSGDEPCDPAMTTFSVMDPTTGALSPVAATPSAYLRDRSTTADGTRLAFTGPQTSVIETNTGAEILSLATEEAEVARLSPDGTLLLTESPSQPRHLELWDVEAGRKLDDLFHPGAIYAEFDRDSIMLLTNGSDGAARVWDVESGRELLSLRGHASVVNEAHLDADGTRVLTLAGDGATRLWTTEPVGEIQAFDLPDGQRRADGTDMVGDHGVAQISTSEETGIVAAVDASAGLATPLMDASAGQVVRLSPDGRFFGAQQALADRSYGTVGIYDAATGELVREMKGLCAHSDQDISGCSPPPEMPFAEVLWDLAFTPDGSRLAMGGVMTRSFLVWETATGEVVFNSGPLWEPPVPAGPVGLAFSPDGSQLAVSAEQSIRVFDTTTWEAQPRIPIEGRIAYLGLRYSPDGEHLVARAFEGSLAIYDTDSWTLTQPLIRAHDSRSSDIEVSPDSQFVVTAGQDGFIKVWEIASGGLLDVIPLLGGGPAQNVEFLDNSDHLLVTGNDGPATVVTLDTSELLDSARTRLTRELTEEECQVYLHGPCQPTLAAEG
jgi:serine/threonine protein kinase/WD40 repeat protein/DNA-binding SARP family transcriptional activator